MTGTNIADNLAEILTRIETAARRAGRNSDEVTLLAVTKTIGPVYIAAAYEAGVRDFGESYVQEALVKRQDPRIQLPDLRWHFIGHLQSNKVKDVVDRFGVIESVDRISLAEEIGRRAAQSGHIAQVLLQVKLDMAPNKFGIKPVETLQMANRVSQIPGIALAGFMGMAPFAEAAEESRPYFKMLCSLFNELPLVSRRILSMGMSNDFEVAVEEGATMVRIGTALFGARDVK